MACGGYKEGFQESRAGGVVFCFRGWVAPSPPGVWQVPPTSFLLVGAGKLDEGIRLYERALALKPRHPDALYNLGVAFTEKGKYDKAIFMWVAAVA